MCFRLFLFAFLATWLCTKCDTKLLSDNRTNEAKSFQKFTSHTGLLFADELKQTLERYLFGICPQTYKTPLAAKAKNSSALTCDLDAEHNDLAARLASLSLRAHSASRAECSQLSIALASTFGDLARTATLRMALNTANINESNKKRKLSKSQKAKLQAKQRTALAVKKKAAAATAKFTVKL